MYESTNESIHLRLLLRHKLREYPNSPTFAPTSQTQGIPEFQVIISYTIKLDINPLNDFVTGLLET